MTKQTYVYSGGVHLPYIDKFDSFTATTVAKSEKQARNNICFQYKKARKLKPSTLVKLTDPVKVVNKDQVTMHELYGDVL